MTNYEIRHFSHNFSPWEITKINYPNQKVIKLVNFAKFKQIQNFAKFLYKCLLHMSNSIHKIPPKFLNTRTLQIWIKFNSGT